MRKRLIFPLIALCLLVICLLTLPWPTRFEYTFYGSKVTEDGSEIARGPITISWTQYTYLIKNNRTILHPISVPELDTSTLDIEVYLSTVFLDYDYIQNMIYVKDVDRFLTSKIYLDKEREWCALKIGAWYYVGSVEEDFDAASLLANCENILD